MGFIFCKAWRDSNNYWQKGYMDAHKCCVWTQMASTSHVQHGCTTRVNVARMRRRGKYSISSRYLSNMKYEETRIPCF